MINQTEEGIMRSRLFQKVFLALGIVVFSFTARAGNPIEEVFKRNIISFNLATPFDPNFPRLRIGYTYIVSQYYSQTFELGYGHHKLFPDSAFYLHETLYPNYRMWEMRTESRYYFTGIRKYVIPYAGFELYYISHRQTMYNQNFQPEDEQLSVYYNRADFKRTKTGFNLKTGIIFRMGPVAALELYGGFGIRLRHNHYTNVDVDQLSDGPGWFDDWNYYYYEGPKWNYNLTAGAKLSFLF